MALLQIMIHPYSKMLQMVKCLVVSSLMYPNFQLCYNIFFRNIEIKINHSEI